MVVALLPGAGGSQYVSRNLVFKASPDFIWVEICSADGVKRLGSDG